MDTTDKPRIHTCRFCGEYWQGSHSCTRADRGQDKPARPGDPNYHYGNGAKNDAAIWGP